MLTFALIGITFGVAQPMGGALADRVDARAMVVTLLPVVVAALVALSFAPSPGAFVAGCVVYSLAASTIFAATMKLAARVYGSDQGHGSTFGAIATLTDVMTVVGPLLFLNAYAHMTRATFALMAIACAPFAWAFAVWGRRSDMR
jgi:MFS family permease